ncbi:MAG: plasmid partitioning protein RepB C-terminal domain-containing protein [Achromobacter sp.]|uniref:plasmid partitioning protein RepB C-terminal domain-containing protein n=1 Tax=Achromobacter sp. TaxID=134375 RepID=UPI003CFDBA21
MNSSPQERSPFPESGNSVKKAFADRCVLLDLSRILPLKKSRSTVKQSFKYQQIAASIREVGIVEPLIVTPAPGKSGEYLLLDGHLRIEALKDLGESTAKCLVATDDDTYTYNKRINRLSAVQDHKMIVRAMERGVSAERLASTFNLSPNTIRHRFRLLNGICEEAVELLADTPAPAKVFGILRQMKPLRQIEAAELMVGNKNFSVMFATALLVATPASQLTNDARAQEKEGASSESMARMERELAALQMQSNAVRDSYGPDVLQLSIIQRYLAALLSNAAIVQWLTQQHPEYLKEFQEIVDRAEIPSGLDPSRIDVS